VVTIGGGLTHEAFRWQDRLVSRAPLVRAHFRNVAGVVGAALAAEFGCEAMFGDAVAGGENPDLNP
jgi:hypothetical protein